MAKRFAITKKQFYEWLRACPQARLHEVRCPLEAAVLQLTGKRVAMPVGIEWVRGLARRIDKVTTYDYQSFTRGQLLKLLGNKQ